MSVLFNMPWQQAFDSSGNTLPGAKLYFYSAGTSTPALVYADVGLGTPLSNPVIANAAGRFEPIYLNDGMYKAVLKTADDVLIWTADNIQTTSEGADVSVALAAVTQTSISAGYSEAEAQNPTNFVRSVYKYANSANWYVEAETSAVNAYVLDGLDDYTRLEDYFLGQNVWFVTTTANTNSVVTVNAASLGAKRVYRPDGNALEVGDIYGVVHLIYNGVSFILQEPLSVSAHGNQTIYDTKTFDESPLIPIPSASDVSPKAANTWWVSVKIDNTMKPNLGGLVVVVNNDDAVSQYEAPGNGVMYFDQKEGNLTTQISLDDNVLLTMRGHSGSSHGQPSPCATVIVGQGQTVKWTANTCAYVRFVPFSSSYGGGYFS